MQSKATTVAEYLKSLPVDRRKALEAIRKVVKANLDPKIKEGIAYGMLSWSVPLSVYPDGYHCSKDTPLPFASLASQKNHMALYLFCVYSTPGEPERLAEEWKATGKKLDMGKSCLRFKKLEDVPLEVVGKAIKRMTLKKFIAAYEEALAGTAAGKKKTSTAKKAGKKAASKKAASKKSAAKKAAKKPAAKKAAKKASKKAAPVRKKASPRKAATKKAPARKKATKKKAR